MQPQQGGNFPSAGAAMPMPRGPTGPPPHGHPQNMPPGGGGGGRGGPGGGPGGGGPGGPPPPPHGGQMQGGPPMNYPPPRGPHGHGPPGPPHGHMPQHQYPMGPPPGQSPRGSGPSPFPGQQPPPPPGPGRQGSGGPSPFPGQGGPMGHPRGQPQSLPPQMGGPPQRGMSGSGGPRGHHGMQGQGGGGQGGYGGQQGGGQGGYGHGQGGYGGHGGQGGGGQGGGGGGQGNGQGRYAPVPPRPGSAQGGGGPMAPQGGGGGGQGGGGSGSGGGGGGGHQQHYLPTGLNGEWQSDADMGKRREMIQHIVRLLKQKDKNASQEWLNKLPQMVKQLEVSLYRSAPSFEAYADTSTLKHRLQLLAMEIARKTQEAKGGGGDGGRGGRDRGRSSQSPFVEGLYPQQGPRGSPPSDGRGRGPPQQQMSPQQQQWQRQQQDQQRGSSSGSGGRIVNPGEINPMMSGGGSGAGGGPSQSGGSSSSNQFAGNRDDPEWQIRIRHKQQRLLLLHHSSKCPHEDGRCSVTAHCQDMKRLWKHMARCTDNNCRVSHCFSSRSILSHYRKCKDPRCPACGPVRETVRKSQSKSSSGRSGGGIGTGPGTGPGGGGGGGGSGMMGPPKQRGDSRSQSSSSSQQAVGNGDAPGGGPGPSSGTMQPPPSMPSHGGGGPDAMAQPPGGASNGYARNAVPPATGHFRPGSRDGAMPGGTSPLQPPGTSSSQPPPPPQQQQSSSFRGGPQAPSPAGMDHPDGGLGGGSGSGGADSGGVGGRGTSSSSHGGGGGGGGGGGHPQRPTDADSKIKHKQQRLLLLRHASKCPYEDGRCKVTPYCASMKRLWRHISDCRDQQCRVRHCVSSRYVLSHYRRCRDTKRPACAPVRETIRKSQKREEERQRHHQQQQQAEMRGQGGGGAVGAPPPSSQQRAGLTPLGDDGLMIDPARPPSALSVNRARGAAPAAATAAAAVVDQPAANESPPQQQPTKRRRTSEYDPSSRPPDDVSLSADGDVAPSSSAEPRGDASGAFPPPICQPVASDATVPASASVSAPAPPFSAAAAAESEAPPSSSAVAPAELPASKKRKPLQKAPAPPPAAAAAPAPARAPKKEPTIKETFSLINTFTVKQIETHIESLNRTQQLTPSQLKAKCLDVLKGLMTHGHGWVFNTPVDPIELGLPDYFQIIKRPMDLGTIQKRLEAGAYHALEDFRTDVRLTFDNAMTYNEAGSVVHDMAKELTAKFTVDYDKLLERLKVEEEQRRQNERACSLCGCEKLLFEPPVFFCNGINCSSKRIRRNSHYHVGGNNQYHWCNQCFNELDGAIPIELGDMTLKKDDLKKRKNDEVHEESWVACDTCERWVHQICGLFNSRQNKEHKSEYQCPQCLLKKRKKMEGEGKPASKMKMQTAEDLPRTNLSEVLEGHVRTKVEEQVKALAKEKSESENIPIEEAIESVNLGGAITIRQVTSTDRKLKVRERMKERYAHKKYPDELSFRCKCIVVFQNLDGIDVILFALYVYEHGLDNPLPNKRAVYVSYLDSVHFMRPRKMRTFIYHEILISYLDYVRSRGFATAHIWACPPLKGDDFIFYAKPEDQKTPKDARLRQWYINMLVECQRREIVGKITNMFDLYFSNEKLDATAVPYFEGDYFPGEAENIIKDLEEGKGSKSGSGGKKKKKKKSSGTSKNNKGGSGGKGGPEADVADAGGSASSVVSSTSSAAASNVSGNNAKAPVIRDPVMVKLGEIIEPMKESFIVAYLNWEGASDEDKKVPKAIMEDREKLKKEKEANDSAGKEDASGKKRDIEGNIVTTKSKTKPSRAKIIDDDAEELNCEFFDNRRAFLNLCRGNHYQFDELRRAKHTSMMVLWHFHNRDAPKFVQQCASCNREILTGIRHHCPTCTDFDLCNDCFKNPNTNWGACTHKLEPIKVEGESSQGGGQNGTGASGGNELTEAQRRERQRNIQPHIQLIEHASRCNSQTCSSLNCAKMKSYLKHGSTCKLKASGGCKVCKRIWTLLRIHAQHCRASLCPIPQCMAIRERIQQPKKQ